KEFSWSAVTHATAAGNTFATTGPLLLVTLDAAPPGSVFRSGSGGHSLAIEAWAPGDDSRGLSRIQILRNGSVFNEFIPNATTRSFHTNMPIHEPNMAWYSVRTFAGQAQNRIAISGAFYFEAKGQGRPKPVPARVRVKIVDARSGQSLDGTVTEVKLEGTIPRSGKRHALKNGDGLLTIPATMRLRAQS